MKTIKHILLVCTGNSCRSIMAEGYLKKRIKEEKLKAIEVKSAGTGAFDGVKPPKETIACLKSSGVGPEGLEAKRITKELIDWADIILVMENLHRDILRDMRPDAKSKIFLLGEYNSSGINYIPDPIGMGDTFYNETFDLIKKSVEEFIKWLKV